MMQQKIVADPQIKPLLADELLEELGALNVTARHIRTLVDVVETQMKELLHYASKQPGFFHGSEWDQITDCLMMIDEKADHVEAMAERVVASDWHPWNQPPQGRS